MSITFAGPKEESVVVFKNLPLESTLTDIEDILRSLSISTIGIDRKVDSMGQFRGTAFVRFASQDSADACVDKVSTSDARIHGKKIKADHLRGSNRSRTYSAKDVLEGGDELEARISRVRDIVTAFVYSGKMEMDLPTDLDADQRRVAHSLAEKFGLKHTTVAASGDVSPSNRFDNDDHSHVARTVHLSKSRVKSASNSIQIPTASRPIASRSYSRGMASFMTAAVTNDINKIATMLPEVPVYAAKRSTNFDQIAAMHAAQAQVHAEAARSALEAAKRSKERDSVPDWLEIVETSSPTQSIRKIAGGNRGRSHSNLNPHAPEFIPTNSFMMTTNELGAPPGLTAPA